MHSPFLTPGSSSKIFGCLTGMSYREENFILNNVAYFDLVLANLRYLQEELQYDYHKNGRTYQSILIRNKQDIRTVLNTPTQVGFLISIGGGHSLGNFLYIEQDQVETEEYKNVLLSNIKKLKGATALETTTNEYLDIPIFSINFGNYFRDGICGKTSRFSLNEEEAFKRPTTIDDGITDLGKKAIAELLNRKIGRRILVDVGGMSVYTRDWYYKYIKDLRYHKDSIPISAGGVGISGLSQKDNAYGHDDKKELLSHQFSNLSRQDLIAVLQSRGLVAISLDKNKLMGKGFQARYEETIPNSADRRRVAVDALVSNICKAIHMSNDIEAWNMLCISSQFDTHARHLDVFSSSSDMVTLYRDLLIFFKDPRDINGLYSAKEIKNFMYNLSPEEIVDKIMYKNALEFIERNLPEIKIPTP
jgi:microsomal dipeptidase-like Zn-dependent dipeptidase